MREDIILFIDEIREIAWCSDSLAIVCRKYPQTSLARGIQMSVPSLKFITIIEKDAALELCCNLSCVDEPMKKPLPSLSVQKKHEDWPSRSAY